MPRHWHITWTLVLIEAGLAVLAEILELVAGALGAHRQGGSKRGAVLALLGSLIGAFVGAGLGLPIPVVGSIAGVILGAVAVRWPVRSSAKPGKDARGAIAGKSARLHSGGGCWVRSLSWHCLR